MDKKTLPDSMEYSAVPLYYLNAIMPEVDTVEELKLSILLFKHLLAKKGPIQFIGYSEIISDPAVKEILKHSGCEKGQVKVFLDKAIARGVFFSKSATFSNTTELIYMINTADNRDKVQKFLAELVNLRYEPCEGIDSDDVPDKLPDLFIFYEENIGMLTPIVADELKLAEETYPKQWIIEAIKISAINNKRSLRYILRILERWLNEGKADGAYQQIHAGETPDKYTRGKYQRFVQH